MEQVLNVTTSWSWDSRHGNNLRVMRIRHIIITTTTTTTTTTCCCCCCCHRHRCCCCCCCAVCLSSVLPLYVCICLVMQCMCLPSVKSSYYLHCNTILLSSCCVSYKASTCVLEVCSVEHRVCMCGTSMEDICVIGSSAKSSLKTLHVSSVIWWGNI